MLPPVLEIFVVWHPNDGDGLRLAESLVDHFHGTLFSGLIGGAIEVYIRSAGWSSHNDAPRAIPVPGDPPPNGVKQALFTAIVPLLGNRLAGAAQSADAPWHQYIENIGLAQRNYPRQVGVFPIVLDRASMDGTELYKLLSAYQSIAPDVTAGLLATERTRDLVQGLAQFANDTNARLTVFVSHTKRAAAGEESHIDALVDCVRAVIRGTRLAEFFDASDLQPGRDWDDDLRKHAASSALLAIRTDLYASREWCQREMLIAKRSGMPVVILDALQSGEERGSFLMDHVPRLPLRYVGSEWSEEDVRRGLGVLVDECLKRVLWRQQETLAVSDARVRVSWWAAHAPEPVTFVDWLQSVAGNAELQKGERLRILHPDPPLGSEERHVLDEIAIVAGARGGELDVLTPRLLAARGG
jgi:hypothetical protein